MSKSYHDHKQKKQDQQARQQRRAKRDGYDIGVDILIAHSQMRAMPMPATIPQPHVKRERYE